VRIGARESIVFDGVKMDLLMDLSDLSGLAHNDDHRRLPLK